MAKSTGDSKVVKKIPDTDTGRGVTCRTKSGAEYIISQNVEKGKHTLWRVVEDGFVKVASDDSPYDLYPEIDWES